MSHLGSGNPVQREKSKSIINDQSHAFLNKNFDHYNSISYDSDSKSVKELDDAKHCDQEQYRAVNRGSRPNNYLPQELMNPGSAVSHPAAAQSAAGIYPRVTAVSQHSRSGASASPFESYGLPQHNPQNSTESSGGHHNPVLSQTYRHILPPHLSGGQFSNSSSPHVEMWQKYSQHPWVMAPYEEYRLREREERVLAQERTYEKQKEERTERERIEWQEKERMEREERERAQREAVQQHFEESLRLALQKQQQKNVGWNPVATNKAPVKLRESSPNSLPPNQHLRSLENDRIREREKERPISENHEKWIAMVQHHRNEQASNAAMHQNLVSAEPRPSKCIKQEPSGHATSKTSISSSPISSSGSQMKHETNFSLYGYQPFQQTYITLGQLKAREDSKPSNVQAMRPQSNIQLKPLPLKGEKELSDRSVSPGSMHSSSYLNQSSKHQVKAVHAGQERSGNLYQPLVGSGGAFKPYEYSNSNSPAPPAHQNTSPALSGRMGMVQYQLQDQPQNLVKGDGKAVQERMNTSHKYDSRDKQLPSNVNTLSGCFSPPFASSKSLSPAANTTHSLIQQGLVPNPMYMAASHSGTIANATTSSVSYVHSQTSSRSLIRSLSPPVSPQFAQMSPSSGITSGVPVCRPSSVPYSFPPGRAAQNYSPVGPSNPHPVNLNSKLVGSHEHHLSNRSHVLTSQHRSPSPAHLYGPPSSSGAPCSPHQSSPRLTAVSTHHSGHSMNVMSSSPFHSNSQPESPDVSMSGVPLVKRKLANEDFSRKRPKAVDDSLPPQLQPQVQSPEMESIESQVVAPPNLISNAQVLEDERFCDKVSCNPLPTLTNSVVKSESVSSSSMPVLHGISSDQDVSFLSHNPNVDKLKSSNKTATSLLITDNDSSSSVKSEKLPLLNSQEISEETSTANSTSGSATPIITAHPKLKKAWLQRHSENEDKKNPPEQIIIVENKTESFTKSEPVNAEIVLKQEPFVLLENAICDEALSDGKLKICEESSSDFSEVRTVKSDKAADDESSSSESEEADLSSKSFQKKPKGKNKNVTSAKRKAGSSSDVGGDDQLSPKKESSKRRASDRWSSKKRGRKKVKSVEEENTKKKSTAKVVLEKPPEKPSINQLKKSGEPFLQDGPCCEVAPRLPKCRECRMTSNQRNKKMPNIFCRFYAYRKLRYGKNGTILSAGFSEPSDASEDDFKLWLPPVDSPPIDIDIEASKFLLTHLGDQFCDLVEMEKDAQKMHMAADGTVTWKRVVQGVREMCDVCETTLFNIHWVCHKCGFVVCIDCYKFRKNTEGKDDSSSKERDGYHWLMCSNRQPHEQEKLMLTQIIAGSSLWDLGKTLHEVRRKWNIPMYCGCGINDNDSDSKSSSNGLGKLMSAVTKCFSSDKESSREPNGSESSRSTKRSSKSSVNGLAKQEESIGGYSSESGGSPLSWLADVALNSSSKVSDDQKENDEEKSEDAESNNDASMDSDDEKNENFSTLRELLIRPTGKMGGKSSGSTSSSQKTLTSTLDEVISCVIEQKVRKSDKKPKEKQLLHFTRRYQLSRSGRELPPIRTCLLAESSLLYPEIPHIWLGNGRILLLKDPYHTGNLQLFQEQWKRGQPVIVADVGNRLDHSLWNPESFVKEFGEVKGDFLNCVCSTLLSNQPLKKFWDGFDNESRRIKGDDGKSLVLKMIDWPPGDEFSEVMPSRYEDFMKALPLRQYTLRNGVLNMASRLPECFVQPDLGPRMYNAYGIGASLGKGSTNLHMDVSDVINVLAYASSTDKGKHDSDIQDLLSNSGCDSTMKKRAKDTKPGALWHVFNARDADKIRDFLNKVSEEQGVKLNPHHDPIHNQEWYLDEKLRERLYKEYGVEAYSIAQCSGDAIFIPAGSPHQVQNIVSCIIVSEDFVSPESVGHSFFLTQEIRNLSDVTVNHEDKLQIKNIIYHAVKDALALLQSNVPEDSKV